MPRCVAVIAAWHARARALGEGHGDPMLCCA